MLLKTITTIMLAGILSPGMALRVPLPPAKLQADSIDCSSYYENMRILYKRNKIEHEDFTKETK